MARRSVFWHIGPDDPGTAFLAGALAARREELGTLGVHVPSGPWHEIEDQIWDHKGVSVLSTPAIARAGQDQVDLRLTGLRDVELHLVLLVRELPIQVHASWQAGLQHGSTTPLATYAARVLDPGGRHWQAEDFWAGRDLAAFLPRWTRAIHPDRVHVVAAPSDPDGLWQAFLTQAGIGDLDRPEGVGLRALSADLDPRRVLDVTTSWSELVTRLGFDLHGSLVPTGASTVPAAAPQELFEALADLLATTTAEAERLAAEATRLRQENARLDRKRRKHKRRLAELVAAG
jgi:hypothetical protein